MNKPGIKHAILADVGGTHARFALSSLENPGSPHDIHVYRTDKYPDFESALRDYIQQYVKGDVPKNAYFAFACPVEGEDIRMTNNAWAFSKKDLNQLFGFKKAYYINDFEANALSILGLPERTLIQIGEQEGAIHRAQKQNYLFIGPGTGLGVSILCRRGVHYFTLATEGGHSSFAPSNPLEMQVLQHLQTRFGHVSNERLLAGPGILNLYEALGKIQNQPTPLDSVQSIAQAGQDESDPIAVSTMSLFFDLMASISSSLAISTGCADGVYITSDIILKNLNLLNHNKFRLKFNNRGRFSGYMAKIPIYLVNRPHLGLLGAYVAANHPEVVL